MRSMEKNLTLNTISFFVLWFFKSSSKKSDVLSTSSQQYVHSAQVYPSCSGSQWRTALSWHLPTAPGTGNLHFSQESYTQITISMKSVWIVQKNQI